MKARHALSLTEDELLKVRSSIRADIKNTLAYRKAPFERETIHVLIKAFRKLDVAYYGRSNALIRSTRVEINKSLRNKLAA